VAKFSFLFFGLFCLVLPLEAQAYIPPYWMILSRTADNHGHGAFFIDQDVVFARTAAAPGSHTSDDPLVVHERWTILNESQMRLDVDGRNQLRGKVHLTYIYRDGRRYFVDENGVKKTERAPDDLLEPVLHFRNYKNFRAALAAHGVTPAESAKVETAKYSDDHPLPEPESFVRLARVDGTTSYAIGVPSPVDSLSPLPGLWIEQDRFLIKKIRFPSQVQVVLRNYRLHKDLWLPHDVQLTWPTQEAKISVVSVVPAASNDARFKKLLDHNELNFGKDPNVGRALGEELAIREFYTRLR
jgi:hypothetical protein